MKLDPLKLKGGGSKNQAHGFQKGNDYFKNRLLGKRLMSNTKNRCKDQTRYKSQIINDSKPKKMKKDLIISAKKSMKCDDGHEMELLMVLPDHGVWCGECFDWIREASEGVWFCKECDFGQCIRCSDTL